MTNKSDTNSCCGPKPVQLVQILEQTPGRENTWEGAPWVKGSLETVSGRVPQVKTSLESSDILGAWKARWGINRMNYAISPGLYAVGEPDETSPVFVSANYKMSFDRLRKELTGINGWIMVLDTKGINVWCAAGKGTFGTAEIVRRIGAVGLSRIVSHRTLILPQLGAPGVAAHEVWKQSGFRVVYGPVRASDIKAFLDAGMKATKEMRAVRFGFMDRLCLTPVELTNILKPMGIGAAALCVALLTGLVSVSWATVIAFAGAILMGAVVSPALLPWIPGRAFSWKGWFVGLLWTAVILFASGRLFQPGRVSYALSLLFVLPAISAFLTLNFTGASTYTSLSGVKKEMRFAIPAVIILASAGIGTWITGILV